MDSSNISMVDIENLNKKTNQNDLRKIKSKYILKQVFDFLDKGILLKTVKYNKNIQTDLEIGLNDYKNYSEIEIDIIPSENRFNKKSCIINYINKEEAKHYHIYYNDKINREIWGENKNIITKKIKKIKIIIDHQIKSFHKLFHDCSDIESINFVKFNRKNIIDMSYMFNGCLELKKLNLNNFITNNVTNMSYLFSG